MHSRVNRWISLSFALITCLRTALTCRSKAAFSINIPASLLATPFPPLAPGRHSGMSVAIFAKPDGTCMVALGGEKLAMLILFEVSGTY